MVGLRTGALDPRCRCIQSRVPPHRTFVESVGALAEDTLRQSGVRDEDVSGSLPGCKFEQGHRSKLDDDVLPPNLTSACGHHGRSLRILVSSPIDSAKELTSAN